MNNFFHFKFFFKRAWEPVLNIFLTLTLLKTLNDWHNRRYRGHLPYLSQETVGPHLVYLSPQGCCKWKASGRLGNSVSGR